MLAQTSVATYYMKGIPPYQGWASSTRRSWPSRACWIPSSRCCPMSSSSASWRSSRSSLLGLGRLLDRADGLLGAAHRARPLPDLRQQRRQRADRRRRPHGDRHADLQRRRAAYSPACGRPSSRWPPPARWSASTFVLSDTNDPDIAVAEQQAWLELCRETKGFGKIFYRRRRRRVKQERQHRRLLPALGRRLPPHGGDGRRQRDERRLPGQAGTPDGGQS